MSKRFKITSNAGAILGTFEAATAEEALDKLAQGAGYNSRRHACDVTGEKFGDWTEHGWMFRRGGFALLVEEVTDGEPEARAHCGWCWQDVPLDAHGLFQRHTYRDWVPDPCPCEGSGTAPKGRVWHQAPAPQEEPVDVIERAAQTVYAASPAMHPDQARGIAKCWRMPGCCGRRSGRRDSTRSPWV